MMLINVDEIPNERVWKDKRTLVLEAIPGMEVKSNQGLVNKKLFEGGKNLVAIKDPQYNTWQFRYEHGTLPEPLKGSFTSFPKLLKHAQAYFERRGLKVTKVED